MEEHLIGYRFKEVEGGFEVRLEMFLRLPEDAKPPLLFEDQIFAAASKLLSRHVNQKT